jgi:catechol 2,3-dioxygenase-like lactoylglutathione lyase family enzyme
MSLHARLSHVALRAPAPEQTARFYHEVVGLTTHEHTDGDRIRLGWGRGHHALELGVGGRGLDHFALEVPDASRLERLQRRLQDAGVDVRDEQPCGDHPPVVAFCDPDGNRVELHGRVDRTGERVAGTGCRPTRIHHVTLSSPRLAELEAFYCSVLGFRVSDRMGDAFTWLRCNREHHTVAIVAGDEPGLDHYAYEVPDWAAFQRWCDELGRQNVPVRWGPGRHGPGNNLFIMFDDVDGVHVELSSDMERFWDDLAEYVPRQWSVTTRTVNLWGPAPDWRRPASETPLAATATT